MIANFLLIAGLFPYFKITSGYTQPYPLLIGIVYFFLNYKDIYNISILYIGKKSVCYAFAITVYSLLLLAGSADSYNSLKYFVAILSPIVLVPAYLKIFDGNRFKTLKLLKISLLIWTIVAFLQKIGFNLPLGVVAPDIQESFLNSGRGVSSLAPEPTHYALTVIPLFATLFLLGFQKRYVLSLGLFSVILLSGSSTAIVIFLSSLVLVIAKIFVDKLIAAPCFYIFQPQKSSKVSKKSLVAFAITVLIVILVTTTLLSLSYTETTGIRFINLFRRFVSGVNIDSWSLNSLLQTMSVIDYSFASRIGGSLIAISLCIGNLFVPFGFSRELWISISDNYSIDVSQAGPPSGYISLIFWLGFAIIPFIIYLMSLCFRGNSSNLFRNFIIISSFLVFLMQIYLSIPSFSLLVASAIFNDKQSSNQFHAGTSKNPNST